MRDRLRIGGRDKKILEACNHGLFASGAKPCPAPDTLRPRTRARHCPARCAVASHRRTSFYAQSNRHTHPETRLSMYPFRRTIRDKGWSPCATTPPRPCCAAFLYSDQRSLATDFLLESIRSGLELAAVPGTPEFAKFSEQRFRYMGCEFLVKAHAKRCSANWGQRHVITGQIDALEPGNLFEAAKTVTSFIAIGIVLIDEIPDASVRARLNRLGYQSIGWGLFLVPDHRHHVHEICLRPCFICHQFREADQFISEKHPNKNTAVEKGRRHLTYDTDIFAVMPEAGALADRALVVNLPDSLYKVFIESDLTHGCALLLSLAGAISWIRADLVRPPVIEGGNRQHCQIVHLHRILELRGLLAYALHECEEVDTRTRTPQAIEQHLRIIHELILVTIEPPDPDQSSVNLDFPVANFHTQLLRPASGTTVP